MKKENSSSLVAITVDYETWQPIPKGREINWENDVFKPTDTMIRVFSGLHIPCTFMVEMGEYFWLKKYQPGVAEKMEAQWARAIQSGHDIQLHLHPNWLPETGAECSQGEWKWNMSLTKAVDYPGDLTALIRNSKNTLEHILKPVNNDYSVNSFRAGAYQAQPFKRLHEALKANRIICDSSVYAGGVSNERGYDYSYAYSNHQPYFLNRFDPQLSAPESERGLIELPVFTYRPGSRWFLDNEEGKLISKNFISYLNKDSLGIHNLFFRLIRKHNPSELNRSFHNQYYVMIGHTKAQFFEADVIRNIQRLQEQGDIQFLTLSEMAKKAQKELISNVAVAGKSTNVVQGWRSESDRYIWGQLLNEFAIRQILPWDRKKIGIFGEEFNELKSLIEAQQPWSQVSAIDENFTGLGYDAIVLTPSFLSVPDVSGALRKLKSLLQAGGCLIAYFPCEAINPSCQNDQHSWKTMPAEVKLRFVDAGFENMEISEIDARKKIGAPPYAPSKDRVMFVKTWNMKPHNIKFERALHAMEWVYQRLNPDRTNESMSPVEILKGGYAFCWGYAVSLGEMLKREGYQVRWVTMMAKNHPRGRGPEQIDSHEVIEVEIDAKKYIFDPMANRCHPYSFDELLAQPALASENQKPDQRYEERGYSYYSTAFWYERIFRYKILKSYKQRFSRWIKVRR